MKITITSVFECENEKEFDEAMAAIDNEMVDIEEMNKICNDEMSMSIEIEDKDNLKIVTKATYTR